MTTEAGRARLPDEPEAWLFVRTSSVPDEWVHRSLSVSFIPLLPVEVSHLLRERTAAPSIDHATEAVAKLAARGLTVAAMARELNLSTRSIDRRLARLRALFGVGSTAELTAGLAKRGF